MVGIRAALGLLLGAAFAVVAPSAHADEAPLGDHAARTVVVLVFDGFSPALLDGLEAPAFDRMRREGSHTHHMLPVFPSVSLVNGFTLSTGCWPEHHGVVSNLFQDPKRGRYDHSRDADWQTGCEGMHQAAERQGLRTAALGWYGGVSGTKGPQASRVSGEKTWADFPEDLVRAQEVVRLLRLPAAERPRLILAYFRGPDAAAHAGGLDSPGARDAARTADEAVGTVLSAIDAMPERDRVTLFVTSDHGMMPVTTLVNLKRILSKHALPARVDATGTVALLHFDDGDDVKRAEEILGRRAELEVFRPSAPPSWAKIGASPRVGDLVVSAKPPYFLEDSARWPSWSRWLERFGPETMWGGFVQRASHGYPPETPGVEGILYARGSGIAKGRAVPSVRAVDLHPTVMQLLLLEPGKPVDGRVARELLE